MVEREVARVSFLYDGQTKPIILFSPIGWGFVDTSCEPIEEQWACQHLPVSSIQPLQSILMTGLFCGCTHWYWCRLMKKRYYLHIVRTPTILPPSWSTVEMPDCPTVWFLDFHMENILINFPGWCNIFYSFAQTWNSYFSEYVSVQS